MVDRYESNYNPSQSASLESTLPRIIHGICFPVTVEIPDEKGLAELEKKSHQTYELIRKGDVIRGTEAIPSMHNGLPISPRRVNGHVEFDREGGNYSD